MATLTLKQQAFAECYLVCRNGSEAARRAGYAVPSARITASRLLTNANIKAELALKQAELAQKVEITQLRVVNELLNGIAIAESNLDASTVMRGWLEIAKLLDLYKAETQNVAPSAENDVLRAKYEVLSDSDLMDIAAGNKILAVNLSS